MPNLALDSRPLGKGIYDSTDYSGLQLFGLEHRPLHRAVAEVQMRGERCIVRLGEHVWDDGSPITARDYVAGLDRILRSKPVLAVIFRNLLRGVEAHSSILTFEFRSAEEASLEFLDLPNWAPFRPGHRSGHFAVFPQGNGWRLEQDEEPAGSVAMVHSPEENLAQFKSGAIDYSADTAVRFEDIEGTDEVRDTGLFGYLAYSMRLNADQVQNLNWDLSQIQFPDCVNRNWPPLRPEGVLEAKGVRRGSLTLAFDPFYPNREIAEIVAAHLQDRGWIVELKQDCYYQPRSGPDIKFMIGRGLARNPLFEALSLWGLPRASLVGGRLRERHHELESMSALGLGFPLFRIPSRHRARLAQGNPLLEVFA